MTRRLVLVLAIVALTAGCGGSSQQAEHPATTADGGNVLEPPVVAPDFALRDQSGRPVGPRDFRGHWFVIAFLYTHCPDVCPLIANQLANAQRSLPNLGVLAVSVDPKGDTRAAVRTFIRDHRLGPKFRYLTGSRAQLMRVWRNYHVAALTGPQAIVSHSAFELLVDPSGRERVLYDAQIQAAQIGRDIARLS